MTRYSSAWDYVDALKLRLGLTRTEFSYDAIIFAFYRIATAIFIFLRTWFVRFYLGLCRRCHYVPESFRARRRAARRSKAHIRDPVLAREWNESKMFLVGRKKNRGGGEKMVGGKPEKAPSSSSLTLDDVPTPLQKSRNKFNNFFPPPNVDYLSSSFKKEGGGGGGMRTSSKPFSCDEPKPLTKAKRNLSDASTAVGSYCGSAASIASLADSSYNLHVLSEEAPLKESQAMPLPALRSSLHGMPVNLLGNAHSCIGPINEGAETASLFVENKEASPKVAPQSVDLDLVLEGTEKEKEDVITSVIVEEHPTMELDDPKNPIFLPGPQKEDMCLMSWVQPEKGSAVAATQPQLKCPLSIDGGQGEFAVDEAIPVGGWSGGVLSVGIEEKEDEGVVFKGVAAEESVFSPTGKSSYAASDTMVSEIDSDSFVNMYKNSLQSFFSTDVLSSSPAEEDISPMTDEIATYPVDEAVKEAPEVVEEVAVEEAADDDVVSTASGDVDEEVGEKKPTSAPKMPSWSMGAEKHFSGLCSPCGFYYKKECLNGADCNYCHMCSKAELRRRKKEKVVQVRREEAMKRSTYKKRKDSSREKGLSLAGPERERVVPFRANPNPIEYSQWQSCSHNNHRLPTVSSHNPDQGHDHSTYGREHMHPTAPLNQPPSHQQLHFTTNVRPQQNPHHTGPHETLASSSSHNSTQLVLDTVLFGQSLEQMPVEVHEQAARDHYEALWGAHATGRVQKSCANWV